MSFLESLSDGSCDMFFDMVLDKKVGELATIASWTSELLDDSSFEYIETLVDFTRHLAMAATENDSVIEKTYFLCMLACLFAAEYFAYYEIVSVMTDAYMASEGL